MDFWLAIVIIVVVGSATETIRQYLRRKEKGSAAAEKMYEELRAVMNRQDERIQNLETVILEMEKDRKYQDL